MAFFNWQIIGLKENPFSKFFSSSKNKEEQKTIQQQFQNSQGLSQEDILTRVEAAKLGVTGYIDSTALDFEPVIKTKKSRVAKYREMSLYAEIADALDQITNDAIVDDANGEILTLKINKDKAKRFNVNISESMERKIRLAFDYFINDVMKFDDRGEDFFRKWLVEGELFLELVSDKKGKNIIGTKVLPCWSMIPIYQGSKIIKFVQVFKNDIKYYRDNEGDGTSFEPDQIAYSNYGLYGENLIDVRGYLEAVIRLYNQLRNLEDAIVVYRIVRAPERRVWNVFTGRLPKGKAEEYMKGLVRRYKKKNVYNSSSGQIDSVQNIQSVMEDYWFSKDESGNGTTVETIGGGMNLGEIEDLNYFMRKFYKTLKLPSSRWQMPGENTYNQGKIGEITREEIKFSRFVQNLQKRFGRSIILAPFKQLLRMRDIDEKVLQHGIIDVEFTESNLFKEYKELEILESRFGMFSNADAYIYNPSENPSGYFSQEYAMKHFFRMTDEEYEHNKELLEEEKKKNPPKEGGSKW